MKLSVIGGLPPRAEVYCTVAEIRSVAPLLGKEVRIVAGEYPQPVREAGFGAYLTALRESRGWSFRDAAYKLGVSYSDLHKNERGTRAKLPTIELIITMANGYGVPVNALLEAAGYPPELRWTDAGAVEHSEPTKQDERCVGCGLPVHECEARISEAPRQS